MSEYFNTTDWIFYDVNEEFEEDEEEEASVSPINSADERTDAELAELARHMHIESSSGRNTPSPPPSPPPPQIEEEEHHESNELNIDSIHRYFLSLIPPYQSIESTEIVALYNRIVKPIKPFSTKRFGHLLFVRTYFTKFCRIYE